MGEAEIKIHILQFHSMDGASAPIGEIWNQELRCKTNCVKTQGTEALLRMFSKQGWGVGRRVVGLREDILVLNDFMKIL